MTFSLPAKFTLARYRLTLVAQDNLRLPPVKSSALRGGFGHVFKRLACQEFPPCAERCRRGNACAYGYVFETTPPQDSQVLRNLSEVPRPFIIIVPPEDQRRVIRAGEQLVFGLTLIGHGIQHLPYFIVVFRELGRIGLGRDQGRYRLTAIDAVRPYRDETEPIYRAGQETIMAANLALNSQAILDYASTLPADQLTLDFRTPVRLKHESRWVNEGPPFQALVKVLLSRFSSLCYFHCGQRLEVDFRGLIDRAAGVDTVRSETRWEDWSRFSGRQKQWIELGGLLGRVTYAGDLSEYLPLLALGELIHAGKGTVFGNGQYQITRG